MKNIDIKMVINVISVLLLLVLVFSMFNGFIYAEKNATNAMESFANFVGGNWIAISLFFTNISIVLLNRSKADDKKSK